MHCLVLVFLQTCHRALLLSVEWLVLTVERITITGA
ncbi:UBC core domain-containing protein [Psidium guajava]|nr:UBC core domain-containing protein [Psidium guajava]